MDEQGWLTERFEEHRPRLRAVAYRMLGSVAEADDAVQDAWLRGSRADTSDVDNLGGWLTTVVARVCLNLLRTRERRRETPLEVHVPDPIISPACGIDPEHEALLADSVGLALQVVLETLIPAERVAFVLHDLFAVPFDEIAAMIERSRPRPDSSPAAPGGGCRARRRRPTPTSRSKRVVVDAFFAAARDGEFDALVAVLDPEIVLRADGGAARGRWTVVIHGAGDVAAQAVLATKFAPFARPALVNGPAGAVTVVAGKAFSVMAFTVVRGRIAAIDVLYDPERLADLDPSALDQ